MERENRKSNRLEGFDYSSAGIYFITVCTLDKAKILCHFVGGGVLDAPECVLTEKGRIVEKYINSINNAPYAWVDKYVIMPNHVHLLLRIEDFCGTSRTPSPTNAVIPHVVSTFKRFCSKAIGENIFQRSYNDHIIRDEADYLRHWNYIDTNPVRWQDDEYFS